MEPIYLSPAELRTVCDVLDRECAVRMNEFDQAQRQTDCLSQRRAVRAAKDARRLHELLGRMKACIAKSLV